MDGKHYAAFHCVYWLLDGYAEVVTFVPDMPTEMLRLIPPKMCMKVCRNSVDFSGALAME